MLHMNAKESWHRIRYKSEGHSRIIFVPSWPPTPLSHLLQGSHYSLEGQHSGTRDTDIFFFILKSFGHSLAARYEVFVGAGLGGAGMIVRGCRGVAALLGQRDVCIQKGLSEQRPRLFH